MGDPREFLDALASRIDLLREPDEDYNNRQDGIDLLAWIDSARRAGDSTPNPRADFIEAARAVAVNGSNRCGHINPDTLEDRKVAGGVVVPEHLWQRLHDAHLEAFFEANTDE